ncbi:MAG: ArnT family glycosyltransferase [Bdellovibrio sp.]
MNFSTFVKKYNQNRQFKYFLFSLLGIILSVGWIYYLSPRPQNINIINPDLSNHQNANSTVSHFNQEGLYWISFTTEGRSVALDQLKIRTFNCINSFSTTLGDLNLPADNQLCDNHDGFILTGASNALKKDNTWYVAGDTKGGNFGIHIGNDWTQTPLILGMTLLLFSIGAALFLGLPIKEKFEKSVIIFFLLSAFLLRFWYVFINSPIEMSLFSDMAGYFDRGWDIDQGIYSTSQLFQPIGYVLLSLVLRKLGGFDLLSWFQIFFSWGTVLLTFLIVRNHYSKTASNISVLVASFHIPLAAMAALHLAENVYAFLITLSIWWLSKTFNAEKLFKYFVLGFLLSLAFYFKGNHSFFIPAFLAWLLYKDKQQIFVAVKKISALILGCLVVVIPHLLWTAQHYGKPYFGPTAGALNFVEGKCPSKNNEDSEGQRWMSPLFVITGETEFKQWPRPFTDQTFFWQQGIKCVQKNPSVLLSSLRYIYYLFYGNHLWPVYVTSLKDFYLPWEYFFQYVFLPLSLLGFLVLQKKEDKFLQSVTLIIITLFFTVWFFKSENRFRVPFDSIFISWASVGAAWIFENARQLVFSIRHKMIHTDV